MAHGLNPLAVLVFTSKPSAVAAEAEVVKAIRIPVTEVEVAVAVAQ
tara:strand:- start:1096 stop:1233 length:138 start_codon:yes stop_codon:yes gene_type:complete